MFIGAVTRIGQATFTKQPFYLSYTSQLFTLTPNGIAVSDNRMIAYSDMLVDGRHDESECAGKHSEVVRTKWTHEKKNGEPDGRFKNNPLINIYKHFGVLQCTVAQEGVFKRSAT